MSSPIRFFEKSYIDFNNEAASIAVVDTQSTNNGQDVVDYLRSRSNNNAWITSGSQDSYNTALELSLGGAYRVKDILLLSHNFKDYTLDYDENETWINLVTVVGNSQTTNHHTFDEVVTSKIRLRITGTQIPNDNKKMRQMIVTRPLLYGQLEGFPIVKPALDQNKKITEMLSGKSNIAQSLGGYSIDLSVKSLESANDLEMFIEMYSRVSQGFLIWPNAGDDNQFRAAIPFWRGEDIFLVRVSDPYKPEWFSGIYSNGVPIKTRLKEVII